MVVLCFEAFCRDIWQFACNFNLHFLILCTILCVFFQALSEEELSDRRKQWTPVDKPVKGLLLKYRRNVGSAHNGAITQ